MKRNFFLLLFVSLFLSVAYGNQVNQVVASTAETKPLQSSLTLSQEEEKNAQEKDEKRFALLMSVVPAVLALIGVLIAHLISIRQFTRRVGHEVDLKIKESQVAFQRSIYIEAAEKIAELTNSIVKMANLSDVESETSKVSLGPVINKVNMIGSNETIDALADFSRKSGKILMTIYLNNFRKKKYVDKDKALSDRVADRLNYQKLIGQELANLTEEQKNRGEAAVLVRASQAAYQEISKITEERNILISKITEMTVESTLQTFESLQEVSDSLIAANIAIRKELKFDFDAVKYRSTVTASYQDSLMALKDFAEKAKLLVTEEI